MSDGRAVAPNEQDNTHVPMEKGMRTMNWGQGFLYMKKPHEQLRRLSLLVIGCHI
jgi:hypothetical protein